MAFTTFNYNKQHTLSQIVEFSGTGLHTGKQTNVRLIPQEPNFGIKFHRVDISPDAIIEANCDLVVETQRGTTLQKDSYQVQTTEHLLATLVGCGIDNCLIEIDAKEIPILDGSSIPFVDIIKKNGGVVEQDEEKHWYSIDENLSYINKETKTELLITPNEEYSLTVLIDFNSPTLGTQHASLDNVGDFEKEIAACRTFCFLHEIEQLYKNNLIKGGDLNNAIVVVDTPITTEVEKHLTKIFNQEKIEIKAGCYLNNLELRYPNEPARHKLLDIIGDLALIGYPIKGKIYASRPGHKANVEFAKIIKSHIKKNIRNKDIPKYDPAKEPLYNISDIEKVLPHRHPFLLVEKILELSNKKVVGLKNVSYDEWFFRGHFPNNPIFPGVLELEALAQTGGILVLGREKEPHFFDTYFLKINNCKFKRKVIPGDTMLLQLQLLEPIRRGIASMFGQVYVAGKLCCEAELVAQVIDRRTLKK